jgi:MoaA/NifB/PqqE/SkfB family radical SAM enzyme
MCTRTFEQDPQVMMPLDLFKERIVPVLPRFRSVNLAGWGEPLMNGEIVEMLRLCKESGIFVCFNTNGLLMKPPLSREILSLGVDQILISCDAAKAETYEYVRGKGTFDVLLDRMRHTVAVRDELGVKTSVEWVYVMLKHNLEEVPAAVRFAGEFGFDCFKAKHMETALDLGDLDAALFNTGVVEDLGADWDERYLRTVAEARGVAEEVGIEFILHPRRYAKRGMCHLPPDDAIFVDHRGNVSACCYLTEIDTKPYIPVDSRSGADGILGNLHESDLLSLVESEEHDRFRRSWREGVVPEACRGCLQVGRMGTSSEG